jgi:hypothetical protein
MAKAIIKHSKSHGRKPISLGKKNISKKDSDVKKKEK